VSERNSGATTFFVTMSRIGGPAGVAVIAAVVAIALLIARRFRWAALLAINSAGGGALDWELKRYFARTRPDVALMMRKASGYSFPSGHAMGSTVLFAALSYLAIRSFPRWRWKSAALAFSATMIVAVALSRDGVANGVRRLRPHVSRLSGALLIAAGAYVVYYWAFELASPTGSGSGSKPIRIGTQISTSVQAWLSGHTGKTVSASLAGLLAALAVAILARAARRRALRRTSSDHADLVRPTPPSLAAAMLREPSRTMMEADRAPLKIRD